MMIDELIKELKYTVLHLPWSQIRKGADEVVDRVVATLEAQQGRIEELEAELKEERYRHDRVQDFEVAEAQILAKLREERRWIPVGERLPENDYGKHWKERKHYLVRLAPSGLMCVAHYGYKEYGWWIDGHDCVLSATNFKEVTHWMPLPEPPKEDS